ncbi:hypothetical protein LC082_13875 [Microbacterium esteraromaticum]|uniref:hypothetical protein n=1 Tax=Microbacterium esteraromaticum TaxID=57043 RepID=UPI001CD61094|nr:hypothetical protein [Microbacterium esteraromaticum]MCA1307986.1 hypothetical protein [Microbacterium esteraromaticum]
MADRIYYEDEADWAPSDYYALWRYLDRLAEYVEQPERRSPASAPARPASETKSWRAST